MRKFVCQNFFSSQAVNKLMAFLYILGAKGGRGQGGRDMQLKKISFSKSNINHLNQRHA